MAKFSLDISNSKRAFINVEVEDDRVLIGAYESGKVTRKLFYLNKQELELLIKGLNAVNNLI